MSIREGVGVHMHVVALSRAAHMRVCTYVYSEDVYDGWWKGKPGCHSSNAMINVDEAWLRGAIEQYAVGFANRHNVPVHCNQWGVKDGARAAQLP